MDAMAFSDESITEGSEVERAEEGSDDLGHVRFSDSEEKLRRSRVCILSIKQALIQFTEGMEQEQHMSWAALAGVCLKDIRSAIEEYDSGAKVNEEKVRSLMSIEEKGNE